MTNGPLKQQLMQYVSKRPYTFGQLKRLETFENRSSQEIGEALRDLGKLGQIRVFQYWDQVYFRESGGLVDLLATKLENFNRKIFDRFEDRWIPSGRAAIEKEYPENYVSVDLAMQTMERSGKSWEIKYYVPHERMIAVGVRRRKINDEKTEEGEIILDYDVSNSPNGDIVSLEGTFYRERFETETIHPGNHQNYLWPIFSDLIGIAFKTQVLDSYSRTIDFVTNKNEAKIKKVIEFLREYHKRRYPWSFKPLLQPWVIEFFSNPRMGTTPRALRMKSRGFRKHQGHLDYVEYRTEVLSNLPSMIC
jgi:hypothetical protein